MPQLELEPRISGSQATVVVRGDVDLATVPQFRDLLNELVDGGNSTIVLECSELAFLDSSGIGVLVAIRKRLGSSGSLTIDSPPPHVRKVLEITGLNDHVVILP